MYRGHDGSRLGQYQEVMYRRMGVSVITSLKGSHGGLCRRIGVSGYRGKHLSTLSGRYDKLLKRLISMEVFDF